MKNMHRREFSTALLGASVLAAGLPAAAQGGPVEGTHYVRLGQPLPVTAPSGKVEVVEFFWYGCPHCNAFEPMLDAWTKKLPADVSFRRVPVAFRDEPFGTHQRIYYALETMNQVEAMHRKVFYAIHNDRQKLDKPAEIAAFMTKNGVDGVYDADPAKVPTATRFDHLTYLDAGPIAEAQGAAAVALHARTAEQAYSGKADWKLITDVKRAVKSIPIIGNGDVTINGRTMNIGEAIIEFNLADED